MLCTNGSALTQVTVCPGCACRIVGVKQASTILIAVPVPRVIPSWQPPPARAGAAPNNGATPKTSTMSAFGIVRMMGSFRSPRGRSSWSYTGGDGLIPSVPGQAGEVERGSLCEADLEPEGEGVPLPDEHVAGDREHARPITGEQLYLVGRIDPVRVHLPQLIEGRPDVLDQHVVVPADLDQRRAEWGAGDPRKAGTGEPRHRHEHRLRLIEGARAGGEPHAIGSSELAGYDRDAPGRCGCLGGGGGPAERHAGERGAGRRRRERRLALDPDPAEIDHELRGGRGRGDQEQSGGDQDHDPGAGREVPPWPPPGTDRGPELAHDVG